MDEFPVVFRVINVAVREQFKALKKAFIQEKINKKKSKKKIFLASYLPLYRVVISLKNQRQQAHVINTSNPNRINYRFLWWKYSEINKQFIIKIVYPQIGV